MRWSRFSFTIVKSGPRLGRPRRSPALHWLRSSGSATRRGGREAGFPYPLELEQQETSMRNRDRFIPLFLLSLTLAAAGVSAQDKAQKPQGKKAPEKNPYVERFKQLDRNGDGFVALAEWPLDRASFERVDRDKDGRLSRGELLTPNRLRDDLREEQFHA